MLLHRCWRRMLETKGVGDNHLEIIAIFKLRASRCHQHHCRVYSVDIFSLHSFSKWICHYLTSRPYPDLFKALTNLAGGQQEFTIFSFSRSHIKTAEMAIKGQTRAKLRNSNSHSLITKWSSSKEFYFRTTDLDCTRSGFLNCRWYQWCCQLLGRCFCDGSCCQRFSINRWKYFWRRNLWTDFLFDCN